MHIANLKKKCFRVRNSDVRNKKNMMIIIGGDVFKNHKALMEFTLSMKNIMCQVCDWELFVYVKMHFPHGNFLLQFLRIT